MVRPHRVAAKWREQHGGAFKDHPAHNLRCICRCDALVQAHLLNLRPICASSSLPSWGRSRRRSSAVPRVHQFRARACHDVLAARDESGALHLPVNEDAPVPSSLLYAPWCCFFLVVTLFRMYVRAVVRLTPSSGAIGMKDVVALGSLVEKRCPVAAMLVQAGVQLDFRWMLTPLER